MKVLRWVIVKTDTAYDDNFKEVSFKCRIVASIYLSIAKLFWKNGDYRIIYKRVHNEEP